MVQRWLYSTNAKDIAVLYFIFAIFCGMAGTAMSVIIRLELAAPGNQYLHGQHQLFNGARYSVHYSMLLWKKITVLLITLLLIKLLLIIKCVKHIAYLIRANLMRTIACYKKDNLDLSWVKNCMVRMTNFFQILVGIVISPYHSDIVNQVYKLYVEIYKLWLIDLYKVSSFLKDEGPKQFINGNEKSIWSAENGNIGVDRGIIVLNTQQKLSFSFNFIRKYHTNKYLLKEIEKDTSKLLSKELNFSSLIELEKLYNNNNKTNYLKLVKNLDILILSLKKIKNKSELDDKDINLLIKLSNDVGSGRFKFKPLNKITLEDKIIQETIKYILNYIYINKISKNSHGFRLNTNCHTAVWQVRNMFSNVNWLIEINLNKYLDNISHDLIIKELNKYIEDKGFIDLVYKYLRVGYYDNKGIYHNNKISIPKNTILSSLFNNIILILIDNWIENYINIFNKGNSRNRKVNPEYKKYSRLIEKTNKFSERIKLQKLRRKEVLFSIIRKDPNYKKIQYVRYEKNILIGIIGSKNDCNIFKNNLNNYLNSLGFIINNNEIIINCSSKKPTSFLNYDISVTPKSKEVIIKNITNRTIKSKNPTRIILNAPIKIIVNRLILNGYAKNNKFRIGVPTIIGRLIHEEPHIIINHYLTLGYGILDYYKLATNFNTLKHRIWYILFYSCVLTFASKYKTKTIRKTIKKFGFNLSIKDNKGNIIISFPKNVFNNIKNIKNHNDFFKSSYITKINNPFYFIDNIKFKLPIIKFK